MSLLFLELGEGIRRTGIETKGRIGFTSIKTLTSAGHEFFDYNEQQHKAAIEILDLEKGKRNKKSRFQKKLDLYVILEMVC